MTLSASPQAPRSRLQLLVWCVLVSLAFAGFAGLGIFQIKRLAWKEALIARVERHVHAPASPPPAPHTWPTLQRDTDEYRRLVLKGRLSPSQEVLVHASTELGAGYWVMTPLLTDTGFWVWINRGFVPTDMRDPAQRKVHMPSGDQTIVGLLRMTEPGGTWLQKNNAASNRWYSRDVDAMTVAQGLAGKPVAPYFVDAAVADTTPPFAWPRPGLTILHFHNNHLVYALTWFTLAAMTVGALGYLLVDERRLRRLAGERQHHAPHTQR